ncbi:MAG: response regulator [Bacteroidales bacterium]|nr:response regulator [Bacteroidales bacterium]
MTNNNKLKDAILYVDDEQANLDGFLFTFRREYDVYTALNANDALDILQERHVKIVISDQRMPGMQGTDLLEIVSEKYPNTVRILLTAFTDADATVNAINKGKVYRYITKPWVKQELQATLQNALESYKLRDENSRLLENLKKLTVDLSQYNERLQTEITERKKAEDEVTLHKNHLEELVIERTAQLDQSNAELKSSNEVLNTVNEHLKQEINQRIQTEKSLRYSEEKFRQFFEQSSDAVTIVDQNGIIMDWNTGAEQIYDIPKEQAIGHNIIEIEESITLSLENDKNAIRQKVKDYLKDPLSHPYYSLNYDIKTQNGNNKFIGVSIFPVQMGQGTIVGRITKVHTLRRRAESELEKYKNHLEELVGLRTRELQLSETRLRTLSDNLPDGAIFRLNHNLTLNQVRLEYASANFSVITGVPIESVAENFDSLKKIFHKQKNFLFRCPATSRLTFVRF